MSATTQQDVAEGDLVTFEAPSGTTRYGVVVDVEWAPTYGTEETWVTVRTEGVCIRVNESDLL